MRPISRRHSRRGPVGGSTFRRTPISRSPLDKNPMPGHLYELHPVNEVNTKGQFFRASFGKNPRFQIQRDKRPLFPVTGSFPKTTTTRRPRPGTWCTSQTKTRYFAVFWNCCLKGDSLHKIASVCFLDVCLGLCGRALIDLSHSCPTSETCELGRHRDNPQ